MRILHITSHLNVGGITSYLVSLSKVLVERGHRVIVASGGGRRENEVSALGGVHWRVPLHTKAEFSPQVFLASAALSRRLRQEPVDVIHAHTRVAQVVAHRLSRRHRIPYVATWHGFFRRNLGRKLWPCTGDATIAISEPVRQHLLQDFRVAPERVRLIPNGADVAYFAMLQDAEAVRAYRRRWQIPDAHRVIGGMGRLASGRVKGFDLLLAAAALVRQQVPELHVVVVGDGPRRPFLEVKAQRLGLQERVHFVGATDDVRLPLAAMEVFVFPSRWPEGFGLALIEAMACGRPVVATNRGAVPDIVRHGQDGWLVPPEDPQALADGIVRLLRDPETARRMGDQAQARVRDVFSLDRMAAAVETVYQELLTPGW